MNRIDAHQPHDFFATLPGSASRDFTVRFHGIGQLGADRHDRIERIHGALHHHRKAAPPQMSQLFLAQMNEVLSRKQHVASGNLRIISQQAGNGEAEC